ncbi:MAG: SRPBCC family protein [Chloroflexi bacterium]|nr:SRPBCC family protein [Chloroflexota bacterium]MCA2002174.1 SRPBCC family protein [Chloroflexota bacterium]
MIHYLHKEQIIPASIEAVWEYFSDPKNLNVITPPDMNFEIVAGGGEKMRQGQIIEYRVEFIRGLKSLWLTEISHVCVPRYFVDEQRVGPYRFWYHEHRFEETAGGVKMTDHVTYAPPFGVVGDAVNALWIRAKLKRIFDFRFEKINEIFGSGK